MNPSADRNTFACLLTSRATGAVGVVRVWGRGALEVADRVFRPARGKNLSLTPIGIPRLGRAGEGLGDEVVGIVVRGRLGAEVELQGHGGRAATRLLIESLENAGASIVDWNEWLAWAYPSRVLAEAMEDLARAPTLLAAEILLDQADGALEAEYQSALRSESAADSLAKLNVLLDRGRIGTRLIRGFRVALAGRPNVGKSRLLNAIVGFERAIVSPIPGTTRDAVAARAAVGGLPMELCDTAGLREATDPIELAGIVQAKNRQARADLVLLVFDRSVPFTDLDRELSRAHPSALAVVNKIDLPNSWSDPLERDPDSIVFVSAAEGEGLDRLLEALRKRLMPDPIPLGAGVPFRVRHLRAIRRAARELKNRSSADFSRREVESGI